MRQVNLSRAARKSLEGFSEKHQRQLAERLLALAADARPHDSRKLKDSDRYRVDVGKYRIVYAIESREVLVDLIEKRDGVYKRLRRR
jgi:mRNA-degrading endonuclease RelE of RelBE toxin-antitoxin system